MSKWSDFYGHEENKFRSFEEYYQSKIRYKLPLIRQVQQLAKKGRIVELGCGTGLSCIYLSTTGLQVVGVEKDMGMLNIATYNNKRLNGRAKFCQQNLECWKPNETIGVTFNNGVMEHFSDDRIIHIINHVLSYSKHYVIGIPTAVFKPTQAVIGDERFMKLVAWRRIIARSNARIVKEVYYNSSSPPLKRALALMIPDYNQFVAFVLERI